MSDHLRYTASLYLRRECKLLASESSKVKSDDSKFNKMYWNVLLAAYVTSASEEIGEHFVITALLFELLTDL